MLGIYALWLENLVCVDPSGVRSMTKIGCPHNWAQWHIEDLLLQGYYCKIKWGSRHPELPACRRMDRQIIKHEAKSCNDMQNLPTWNWKLILTPKALSLPKGWQPASCILRGFLDQWKPFTLSCIQDSRTCHLRKEANLLSWKQVKFQTVHWSGILTIQHCRNKISLYLLWDALSLPCEG